MAERSCSPSSPSGVESRGDSGQGCQAAVIALVAAILGLIARCLHDVRHYVRRRRQRREEERQRRVGIHRSSTV